jgi:hypothetical protein
MKTSNMAIMSVAILGIGLLGITSVSFNDVSQASSLSSGQSGAILGHVTAIHTDADGNILTYSQGDNIVVNEGIKQMGFLTFGSANASTPVASTERFNIIGLYGVDMGTPSGTTTYAAKSSALTSATDLTPVVINAQNGTDYNGVDGAGNFILGTTFTAGTGVSNEVVWGAAIINDGTSSDFFSVQNFTTDITLNENDQLTVLWDLSLADVP